MNKTFTYKIIVFAGFLILVNLGLDALYKNYVVHNILNNAKDEQFEAYDDTLKYLALGNSHNCINTHILENSFNYGSPGEHYIQTYYKLKHILEKTDKKPENVILFIDISSFGPVVSNRFEYNSYWIKYLDYFEIARIKKKREILGRWLEGKFFSYAGNYKDIRLSIYYFFKIGELNLHHGYRPHRDYRNFAREEDKRKAARVKTSIYLTREGYFDRDLALYFERILKLCSGHDVNVILVRIPVTREYFQEASSIVPVDDLYRKIENIYSRYPNVQDIFDYHDLYFDHPEYFFDADHLNPEGSDMLTRKLREDLASSIRDTSFLQLSECSGN